MRLYVGAQPPESFDLVVAASSDFVPTDASDWSLAVTDPGGRQMTWALTVISATAQQAQLRHSFAAGEVGVTGTYRLQLTCTTPAGTRRSFTHRIEGVLPNK